MILTCPNCTTRFLLSAQALAPEGRTVRCSNCEQEWFETPDPDELIKGLEDHTGGDDFLTQQHEDIPESIKPFNEYLEEEGEKGGQYDKPAKKSKTGGQVAGYLAAFIVFAGSLAVLLTAKDSVYKAWPGSAAFYHMFGINVSVSGERLVFDRVKVNALNAQSILIEGAVLNVTAEEQPLLSIEASIRDESGEVVDKAVIRPPSDTISAESSLPFRTVYQGDVINADHVQLRFLLSAEKVEVKTEEEADPKTASEDDGNTPTPPEDDHADPHGDEAH
ncbi:MAG: zinc-ribbon domain-containing protein [Alphaproteobacteria bacterium]|nr:zinc-ribbon domain-containing protein [Alphaproteobacteria bacterium]